MIILLKWVPCISHHNISLNSNPNKNHTTGLNLSSMALCIHVGERINLGFVGFVSVYTYCYSNLSTYTDWFHLYLITKPNTSPNSNPNKNLTTGLNLSSMALCIGERFSLGSVGQSKKSSSFFTSSE